MVLCFPLVFVHWLAILICEMEIVPASRVVLWMYLQCLALLFTSPLQKVSERILFGHPR